jgi:hypothetical protein
LPPLPSFLHLQYRIDVTQAGIVQLDTDSTDLVSSNATYIVLDTMSYSLDPDGSWNALPLSSTYGVLSSGQWQSPEYMVLNSSRVYLRGLVVRTSGTVSVGDLLATMPSSFGALKLNLCPPRNVS